MIRLQRVGRKNDPSFRMVVTQKEKGPRTGAFLEVLGSYDSRKKRIQLKEDRVKYWLSKGAQPSDTAYNIFVKSKILGGSKRKIKIPAAKTPAKA